MRPLTEARPKPLIEAGRKTLLDHNLDQLAESGITEAVINVHYLPDQIIRHVASRRLPAVTISDERDRLLDSGGGIRKVLPFFGDAPFFTLNADTIWLDGPRRNLVRMQETFDPATMDVLLLVAPVVTTIGWGSRGDFLMDGAGRLRRPDRHDVAPFAYTGVGILKPESFAGKPEIFSLNRIFDEAAENGRLLGLRLDGVFMHVGTPQALAEAEHALDLYDR
ncbi:nucleotidyltransferase family protein [Rhabdaerophilum sp. SD176]|uniref:nucleotidyltransferase family protein n=1 Tax=Rhabdaerophilum sp. SD176 TaxID=2983548 RepID=UPI0024DF5DCC|nr:nucleotidyltransferase family protein [Rhabdaerophilum sp. SD176]